MAAPTAKQKKDLAEKEAELRRLQKHWKGQVRYIKVEDGQTLVFPDWVGTSYWHPEDLTRQVCKEVNMEGKPEWIHAPNQPWPQALAERPASHSRLDENPAAPSPPYDYLIPAYASDTQSGGPANFDGNAGGLDNPRDPRIEGEVPGEYEAQAAAYFAGLKDPDDLAAFQEKVAEFQAKQSEANGS